ncbi:MAG: glycerophosphodiester phosphodiesterase family protein [Verrucomicrobiales bacterium]|nr:glycerophosphodiester phosphodiesterase family protein [Verrucomicrobiales bacterium]
MRLVAFLFLLHFSGSLAYASSISGYIRDIPPEPAYVRQLRHGKVAERRSGTIIIAHRGACTLAPENTLEAYAAAMDFGADGCEVDVRRTADGVLVLFHDDMLDRLTDGFGQVEDLSYTDLLSLHPQLVFGTATKRTRPPTFAALIVLARQRAMLLHLDVKQPGLDDELGRLLDEADLWDHVVAVNTQTLPKLLANPKLKLLRYKGAAYEARRDVDPVAVKALLSKPGQMIMLEDPRLTAMELKRLPYAPVPLPSGLFTNWKKTPSPPASNATNLVPIQHLRILQNRSDADSVADMVALLSNNSEPDGSGGRPIDERRRRERIVERAWAAERLGHIGKKSKRVIELLEYQVQHPSLDPDWILNGLDGHAAARALGRLSASGSAPVLIQTFHRIDPELARVRNPQWTNNPLSWTDWRKMMIVPDLGRLRCDASKQFLMRYVAMSEAEARELSVPQFEEATKALLRQRLNRSELFGLLQNPNSAVRGTAILECLDHPTPDRKAALRKAAPWVLDLPREKVPP